MERGGARIAAVRPYDKGGRLNALGIVFAIVNGLLLLTLPRRLAVVPLLLAAAYMIREQDVIIAGAHFSVLRLLVLVGAVRVVLRGEHPGGLNGLDKAMLAWAAVLLLTSVFHNSEALMFRSGVVWSDLGCYLLLRCFIRDADDVRYACRITCLLLLPMALLMLQEKLSSRNLFGLLLGDSSEAVVRDGTIRARGAFASPILAGTVGATVLPLALYLWKSGRRGLAAVGLFVSLTIVVTATSSGPLVMVAAIVFALLLWPARAALRGMRWAAAALLLALHLVMNDPVYFLMAKIDLAGGSRGWHRAQLIRQSLEHLDEWWAVGTDHTRHWMPTGIPANEAHTDITNHFLAMGVMGGLPLMLIYIVAVQAAFRIAGRVIASKDAATRGRGLLAWFLGAALFGHVLNFFSIALFDQSAVFFLLILALIAALATSQADMPVRRRASNYRPAPGVGRLKTVQTHQSRV